MKNNSFVCINWENMLKDNIYQNINKVRRNPPNNDAETIAKIAYEIACDNYTIVDSVLEKSFVK